MQISNGEPWYVHSEWWLVFATFALVLVTFGLFIYTARLWRATKKMAEDAYRQAKAQGARIIVSNSIAREGARAATESAFIARRSVELSMRPWVYAMPPTLKVEHGAWHLTYEVKNRGKTVATAVTVRVLFDVVSETTSVPPFVVRLREIPSVPFVSLAPGEKFYHNVKANPPGLGWPKTADGGGNAARALLCALIRIDYKDEFGYEHFSESGCLIPIEEPPPGKQRNIHVASAVSVHT